MKSLVVLGAQRAGHIFDFMTRTRLPLLGFLAAGVLAGLIGMFGMPLDMSFRPIFTSDHADVGVTRCQMTCLVPPTVPVAQQSVQKDHRQIRAFGTNLSRHQAKPVGCGDGNPLRCCWVHRRGSDQSLK